MPLPYSETSEQKRNLRHTYLERRMEVSPAVRNTAAAALRTLFFEHLDIEPPRIVAGYLPVRGEIDVLPILSDLVQQGVRCCLPVVVAPGAPLAFREWIPEQEMESGMYGIKTPPASAATLTPDILIIPLLAYNMEGYRLGYGMGYYDLTLKKLRSNGRQIVAIGAGFSLQLARQLPVEPQDERLDALLTEKSLDWVSRA